MPLHALHPLMLINCTASLSFITVASGTVMLTAGREDASSMETTAQLPPEAESDRTANTGGGVASDRLRVHAHLYKPRLKTSSIVPDFQAELRQNASKQGKSAALEYATALGGAHRAPRWASLIDVFSPCPLHACQHRVETQSLCALGCNVLCQYGT